MRRVTLVDSRTPLTVSLDQRASHPVVAAAGALLVALSLLGLGAAPAVGDDFQVTSRSCTGPGLIVEAVGAGNANPGPTRSASPPGLSWT